MRSISEEESHAEGSENLLAAEIVSTSQHKPDVALSSCSFTANENLKVPEDHQDTCFRYSDDAIRATLAFSNDESSNPIPKTSNSSNWIPTNTQIENQFVQNHNDAVSTSDEECTGKRSVLRKQQAPNSSQTDRDLYVSKSNQYGTIYEEPDKPMNPSSRCYCRLSDGVRPATMASLEDSMINSSSWCHKKSNHCCFCTCVGYGLILKHQNSFESECCSEACFPAVFPRFFGLPVSCSECSHHSSVASRVEGVRHSQAKYSTVKTTKQTEKSALLPFKHEEFEYEFWINRTGVAGVAACKAIFMEDTFDKKVKVKLSCSLSTQVL